MQRIIYYAQLQQPNYEAENIRPPVEAQSFAVFRRASLEDTYGNLQVHACLLPVSFAQKSRITLPRRSGSLWNR